jgi:hypothetical protein
MGLNAKKIGGGGNQANKVPQANIAPGTYPARVVQILDLGLQAQRPYQGKDKPPANEIMLTYELVDEFMKDENGNDVADKPRWISETLPFYGLFADKAKSTQRYNALDPDGAYDGDFSKALGQAINVTIVNNINGDKVYDNVATISAMRPRDAANCPELVNPSKLFDLDAPDMDVFNSLPEWLRDKIKGNLNFKGSALEVALNGEPARPVSKVAKAAKPAPQEPEAEAEGDNNNPW